MEEVSRSGLMVQGMKDIGRTTKLTVKELFGMFRKINTKVSGKEIRLMVKVNTRIATEPHMKDSGEMIFNMVKVLSFGMITHATKVNTTEE